MAPLHICVFKITDRASDAWSAFEGANAKLWQVQLDHAARPSCIFDIRGRAFPVSALSICIRVYVIVCRLNL